MRDLIKLSQDFERARTNNESAKAEIETQIDAQREIFRQQISQEVRFFGLRNAVFHPGGPWIMGLTGVAAAGGIGTAVGLSTNVLDARYQSLAVSFPMVAGGVFFPRLEYWIARHFDWSGHQYIESEAKSRALAWGAEQFHLGDRQALQGLADKA